MDWKYPLILAVFTALIWFSLSGNLEADLYVYSDFQGTVHVNHTPLTKKGFKLLTIYRSSQRSRVNLSKYNQKYAGEIRLAAAKYGIDESLIRAVIKAESDFDPYAVSTAGALGLMQLMPVTARRLGVDDSFNPAQNIDGGVRYLMILHERFEDTKLAVAAYHAGENRVAAYGDVPPIPSTLEYVDRVLHYYDQFRKSEKPAKNIYKVIQPNGEIVYTTSSDGRGGGKILFKVD